MPRATTMSLFCGGGGETMGKMLAFEELGIRTGDTVAYALNHWDEAVQTHRLNFPGVECRREAIEEVTAADFGLAGQTINMLWASPSCVHFSTARGGKPVSDQQRSHASEVVERFLKVADVKVLLMENVPEFQTWGPLHTTHSKECLDPKRTRVQRRFKNASKTKEASAPKCARGCLFDKPIKERKGEYFHAFIQELKELGYIVEYRVLCAADRGDPTIRRRFFLQAVKDGIPIRWPDSTHRDPKKPASLFDAALPPWRIAAECIDFDLPCPSIFDRKKPLAENTLKRIAAGIERFVLSGDPFLVNLTHGGRVEDLGEPMKTVTGANRGEKALVSPVIVGVGGRAGQSEPRGPLEPMGTVTTKADGAFVAAHLVRTDMPQSNASCTYSLDEPLRTVTTSGGHAMVEATFVAKHFSGVVGHKPDTPLGTVTAVDHHSLVSAHLVHLRGTQDDQVKRSASRLDEPVAALTSSGTHEVLVAAHLVKFRADSPGHALSTPMPTLTAGGTPARPSTGNAMGLACATLIQAGYGEREGQAPRVLDIQAPLGTVVAGGLKHALVHALLSKEAPEEPLIAPALIGIDQASSASVWPVDDPLSVITTKARHSMAAVYLTKFQQNSQGQDVGAPLDTVMAGAQRFGLVAAFLQRYGKGNAPEGYTHSLDEPMRTQDTRDRFALVTVKIHGQEYVLADICLRMLKPRELARAMGVPETFQFPAGMSQAKQVKMIGNMCPVNTVKALIKTIVEDRRKAFGLEAA